MFSGNWLFYLGLLSVATFVISVLTLPWLVGLIPVNYFIEPQRHSILQQQRPWLALLLRVLKNLLGLALLCGGLLMLFLPGQGLLTLAVGLLLMDYPGKFAFERRIVAMRPVLNGLNWLRAKRNLPPLAVDAKP